MISKVNKYHSFKGTEIAGSIISSMSDNIVVYFDPDVDGMISGYFVCKFLTMKGKRFEWYVNTDRSHDWGIDISKLSGKDVIAVDFRIDESIVRSIVEAGSSILSMDHHVNQDSLINIQFNGNNGLVINNQYPFEDEDGRYLSGAGVVFNVLRILDNRFDTIENRALVGLTLLSDVCNIENDEARGYLYDLYNHKYKGYIKYLIENTLGSKDFGFGVPRLDRKYVDYKFSPAINSNLRFNKEDDVVRFFLGSGKLDLSYHDKQKKLISDMTSLATVKEYSNLRVVVIKDWELQDEGYKNVCSNFVGLLASKYLGTKSVIAYIVSTIDGKPYVKRASFRGNINGADYLTPISKLVNGVGHQSAFGILDLMPSNTLFLRINTICSNVESDYSEVSYVVETSNLSMFINKKGKDLGEYNMYCLSKNNRYIRYKGKNIKKVGGNDISFRKYLVDNVQITSFDMGIDFDNGVIYPILERGYLCLYLVKV